MDISVIGASGACGREAVTRLVSEGILGRNELLQLVPAAMRAWLTSRAAPSRLGALRLDLVYAPCSPSSPDADDLPV